MEKWNNPAETSENLLSPSTCIGEEKLSLGGKWRFLSQPTEHPAPEGWVMPDFDDKKWSRITVPCARNSADGSPDRGSQLTGYYRKSFLLARDHGTRQIILRFEDIRYCALVWVNGEYIGTAKDMRIPAEFDISSAVRQEKNVICVQVFPRPDSALPDDRPMITGIPGEVSLYSLPMRIISRIRTQTKWPDTGPAELHVTLQARNADGFTARIALMDCAQVIGYCECPIREGVASAVIPCPEVQLWCSEQPKLYRVAVILWDGVAVHHTTEKTIALRNITIQDQIFTLNGQPEKLLGVTYSPVDPDTGCACSPRAMEGDLTSIREHNINTVLVPFTVPEAFFKLCDRIGLYVLFTGGIPAPGNEADPQAEDQNRRMGQLFESHPSILAWNIPGDYPGLLPLDRIRIMDAPSRKSDENVPTLLRYVELPPDAEQAVCFVRDSRTILGAVFGAFPDNSIPEHKREQILRELKHLLQPIGLAFEEGILTLTNHSRFCSTDAYLSRYHLTRDGETVVDRELDLSVAPGAKGSIPIETQYDIFRSGRYYLTAEFLRRDTGSPAAFGQWPAAHLRHIFDENPGGTIRDDSGTMILRSGNSAFTVSRTYGSIDQIAFDALQMLRAPVCPVYRNSEDRAGLFRIPDEWDKLSSGKKKLKPSVLEVDHMTRTVIASFKLGAGLMQTLRLYADGSMAVEQRLRTGRTAPSMLGVRFDLKKDLNQLHWFGFGPGDVRSGHTAGQFFGLHKAAAASGQEGVKSPVYTLSVTDDSGQGIRFRSEDGMRAAFYTEADCPVLRLELPVEELKPHTTYTFSFSIQPIS